MPKYLDDTGNYIDDPEEEPSVTDSWWNKAKNMGKATFMGGLEASGALLGIPKAGYEMIGKGLWGYDPLDPSLGSTGEMAKDAILPKGGDDAIGLSGQMRMLGIPGAEQMRGVERSTLGFMTDLASDPTLPIDVAYKPAMALLTAGMAKGTIQSAEQAYALLKKEGVSPDAIESIMDTVFSAGGTAMGGYGLTRGKGKPSDTTMKPMPEGAGAPSGVTTTDIGNGFTVSENPRTGTFNIKGPNGEKITGQKFGEHIEMVSIGKGEAPSVKEAIGAFKGWAAKEGKPIYSTSTNLSTSGGEFRDASVKKGYLTEAQTPTGKPGYLWTDPQQARAPMEAPPDTTPGPPMGKYVIDDLAPAITDAEVDATMRGARPLAPLASIPAQPGGLGMLPPPKDLGAQPSRGSVGRERIPQEGISGGAEFTPPPPGVLPEGSRGLALVGEGRAITPVDVAIQAYLKLIPVKPPHTTSHQALQSLLEKKGFDEIAKDMSEKLGRPISREMLFDGLVAGSEAGRALNSIKESEGASKEIEAAANKNPKVRAALEGMTEAVSGVKTSESLFAKAAKMLYSGDRKAKALYQAMLSGTFGVSIGNILNGTANLTLDTISATLEGAIAETLGRKSEARDAFARAGAYAPAMARSVGSMFGYLAEVATAKMRGERPAPGGIGPASRDARPYVPQYTSRAKEMAVDVKRLVEGLAPDKARSLYHFNSNELATAANIKEFKDLSTFDKTVHFLIAPNIIQDFMVRTAYMQAELAPLAKRYLPELKKIMQQGDVSIYQAMKELGQGNKKFQEELKDAISYGAVEALRATGGLQAMRGTISRNVVDIWSKIPLLWSQLPFMNWPIANALPAVLEHIPGTVLLDALTSRAEGVFDNEFTGTVTSGSRAKRSLLAPEVEKRTEAYKKAYAEGKKKKGATPEEDQAIMLAGKRSARGEAWLKRAEGEGIYKPERVYMRQAMGAVMVATFAAWRLMRGEDNTEYNQVKTPDGEIRDIHGPIGPYAPFALLGDIVGHKASGSTKYDTPEGKRRWMEMLEAMGTGRMEQGSLPSVFFSGQADTDFMDRILTKTASEFVRGMSSGSWVGETIRGGSAEKFPTERLGRRSDTSVGAGLQVNVPGLMLPPELRSMSRQGLPMSIEKTTGKPRELGDPFEKIAQGRLVEENPIQAFLANNKGWVSGRDVLFKNSDSPEYDMKVGEYIAQEYEDTVIPEITSPEFKKESRDYQVRKFKQLMQRAREEAHKQAVWDFLMEGKPLPSKLEKEAKEAVEDAEFKMMSPPLPSFAPERPDPYVMLEMGTFK